MDILEELALLEEEEKEQAQAQTTDTPEAFIHALKKLGCDQDTIEDCLFEPTEKWEWLLNYFMNKQPQEQ